MRATSWILGTLLLVAVVAVADDKDKDTKSGLDGEGYIQKWLVLAPIPLPDDGGGAIGLDKEQIKDEAKLKPKASEKVKVGEKELTWKEHTCKEHLLDFNAILGSQTEDSAGYAVTFIEAPEEMKGIKMKTGSDDQAKVYLNGKEVFKNTDARPGDKDQDTTEVTLKKGVNILVAKVVNEKVEWGFSVRFTDKDDKPIMKLKARTKE
jgi:hypothetical protein